MKILIGALVIVFALLQYKLWIEPGSLSETWHLKKQISSEVQGNNVLDQRNQALVAEVHDLKHGKSAIEQRARSELGMIKPGETFYQIDSKK